MDLKELEILRENDCPEVPWSAWKPKKKTSRGDTQEAGDETDYQSRFIVYSVTHIRRTVKEAIEYVCD